MLPVVVRPGAQAVAGSPIGGPWFNLKKAGAGGHWLRQVGCSHRCCSVFALECPRRFSVNQVMVVLNALVEDHLTSSYP